MSYDVLPSMTLSSSIAPNASDSSIYPNLILERLYDGAQEDCLDLFTNAIDRSNSPRLFELFSGIDQVELQCRECGASRAVGGVGGFTTLPLPLFGGNAPLSSVQSAIDAYLSVEQLDDDFRRSCHTPSCGGQVASKRHAIRQFPRALCA